MNNIQVFTSQHFGQVRVVMRDESPWFVAADVCRALDIGNSRQATSRLDEDEKDVMICDTLGGKQRMAVVNLPGLFVLVLGSRKAEAHTFQRWITHEVLPAIRQEGAYLTPERLHEVLFRTEKADGVYDDALRLLTFLSAEVLAAKRDAEARVLERLLAQGALTRDELLAELQAEWTSLQ